MDVIDWKSLYEISDGASGVYLLEWEDGVLKYGSATDIHARTDELTQLRAEQVESRVETVFGTLARDPEAVEHVIDYIFEDSVGGWIIDGTSIKTVLRQTEGKTVSDSS
jgi:hypothetical protein